MKNTPQLSFIVPVYKKPAEVFKKCLESLFDSSFKDIEVITVFDGPDAELEAIADLFPVKKLVIEHGGAPKARNAGFKLASGRYVSFWDADCYAKPEMARVWMDTFERNPDAAFVYSGYEFANEGGMYASEPFDPYSLECGNFIATMFPVKRELFQPFDETLKAGQDWDFWLRIVRAGGKGVWIQGSGFVTEPSMKGSISFEGWGDDKRTETIQVIRDKHGIARRDMAVGSSRHYIKALHIAKLLDADVLKDTSLTPENYKLILNLGYGPLIRFPGVSESCVKIQYWMPWDIDCLYQIAFRTARESIRLAQKEVTHHWCNEIVSQKRLADLGIEAEVVPLPTEVDDLETRLPEEFRVLVDTDKAYEPILKDLPMDLPHIPIDFLDHSADITKYSLLVSFQEHHTVDEGLRRFLLNGRHVISNVQAPYCGFIDPSQEHGKWKSEIFAAIREARVRPFNSEAQEHYKALVDPKLFKDKVRFVLGAKLLAVVA